MPLFSSKTTTPQTHRKTSHHNHYERWIVDRIALFLAGVVLVIFWEIGYKEWMFLCEKV